MNQIADRRYRELVRLLIPAGPGAMQDCSPWSLEKNRTFSCPCGHKIVIPEAALKLTEVSDEEGNSHDIVHVDLGKSTNCPSCKKPNYELMSFAHRYGLLRAKPQPRKKKQKDAELEFTEFIECYPNRACPHGKIGVCNACDVASDFAFDADRENRFFGR